MSMTKQTYILIANAINLCKVDGTNPEALREVASAIANQFELDNNKFDRQRFYQACGLQE